MNGDSAASPLARFALVLAFVWMVPAAATAQGRADVELELVTFGLDEPVFVGALPGDPDTLLVVEQGGRIRRIVRGRLRRQPFLDIRAKVSSGAERGLLSFAVAPGWPEDRTVFVNYTDRAGDTVIERYRANRRLTRLQRKTGQVVLTVEQPFVNHNGGQIAFGPDGMLYVGMGDGGSGGDPRNLAQDLGSLLGKILRIDTTDLPFTVPADNPVLPGVGATPIWALGVRNPWRFSFDRRRGDLYIADVGQNRREEIDFEPAGSPGGANYGWRVREGTTVFSGATPPATLPLVDPLHEYTHDDGQSVTGGYVYRGAAIPELEGHYFYADFVTQRIWSFVVRNGVAVEHTEWTDVLRSIGNETIAVSSFGEDGAGELYICSYFEGAIYRLAPAGRTPERTAVKAPD